MSNFLSKGGYSDEERYIRERETEKRNELHGKRDAERKNQEGASHWMICPKCGGALQEVNVEGVMVDKCSACEGFFLDKGEMELLTDRKESHSFINAIKGFWSV